MQQIDYENVPFTCFHCKKVGHKEKVCPIFIKKDKSRKDQNEQGKSKENQHKFLNQAEASRKVCKEKSPNEKTLEGEVLGGRDKTETPLGHHSLEGRIEYKESESQKDQMEKRNRGMEALKTNPKIITPGGGGG